MLRLSIFSGPSIDYAVRYQKAINLFLFNYMDRVGFVGAFLNKASKTRYTLSIWNILKFRS